MKALVMSDTHGSMYAMKKIKNLIKDVDVIIHLGDISQDVEGLREEFHGEMYCVKGNCDFIIHNPTDRIEILDGKRVFMTHGDKYNVKYSMNSLMYKAQEVEADVVLFGHNHIASIDRENGTWFINPGSAALPRVGKPSVAEIVIRDGEITASIINI